MEEERKDVRYVEVKSDSSGVSGLGIASLVCAIVGVFIFGGIMGAIAIVFGLLDTGKPRLGIAGLIIGIVEVAIALILWLALMSV
jgi:hypothetical protein